MKGSGARYHTFVYGSLPQWVLDENIGEGDRIEFQQYAGMGRGGKEYRNAIGRVHLLGPSGPVVVMPGDRFGARPTVVTRETFVRVVSRRKAKGNPGRRGRLPGIPPTTEADAKRAAEIIRAIEERGGTAAVSLVAQAVDVERETLVDWYRRFRERYPKYNPKRQKRGKTGAAARKVRPIRQSMRVVSRGVERDVRRAFGGKLPRDFKSNPMSKKEFEFMAAAIANAQIRGEKPLAVAGMMALAVEVGQWSNPRFDKDRFFGRVRQLSTGAATEVYRYVNRYKKNPLAIYGANPKTVRELGRVVEIRYKRKDDGQFYKHGFKTRPRLLALSDGTIAVRP